ncbi:cytidylate kinase-like family protein [Deferrisoma camini]|uniref:cytidylate kinase-like family protein n=1 Tax=Deferrisoma camini TaxID=1035120 RepID=UPI00046D2E90|nr:cytidylate kinase-like family protein [Deferrisoma camini]
MPVITISNQFGAGGPEIGRELAKRLGIDYLDKEILHRVALEVNVPDEEVEEFEEEHHSKFRSFFSTIFDLDALKKKAKAPPEEFAQGYDDRDKIPFHYRVDGWIDSDIYKQMIVKVITALGRRRGVVIVGRGGQVVLQDNPRTVHVRIVADEEDRVAWTAQRRNLSSEEARDFVHLVDARSHDYLRFYFDVDPDQPTLYHAVLNTSRIPRERCVEIIEGLARDLAAQEEPTGEG